MKPCYTCGRMLVDASDPYRFRNCEACEKGLDD